MNVHGRNFILLAAALLAACAEEPAQPRMTYGAPNDLHGMTGTTVFRTFRGTSGWHATDEHYRSATPPTFKGY
jgi:hypothetical protein